MLPDQLVSFSFAIQAERGATTGPVSVVESILRKVRLFMAAWFRDDIKSVWDVKC
jgi:hypothetical protein